MSRTKLTEEQREQRRRTDRERLEQAARELLSSEGWARWVRVGASTGLSRYSLGNQLLISAACASRGITPTHVAGFRAWLALGRCVSKGQKAIYVFAPIAFKERDAGGQETGEKRVLYRSVPVFELSMTEPLPGAEALALEPTRASRPPVRATRTCSRRCSSWPASSGTRCDIPLEHGVEGWCDSERHQIAVNQQLPPTPRCGCS